MCVAIEMCDNGVLSATMEYISIVVVVLLLVVVLGWRLDRRMVAGHDPHQHPLG